MRRCETLSWRCRERDDPYYRLPLFSPRLWMVHTHWHPRRADRSRRRRVPVAGANGRHWLRRESGRPAESNRQPCHPSFLAHRALSATAVLPFLPEVIGLAAGGILSAAYGARLMQRL